MWILNVSFQVQSYLNRNLTHVLYIYHPAPHSKYDEVLKEGVKQVVFVEQGHNAEDE